MTMDLNLKSTTLPECNIESQCDSGAIQPRICASGNDLASQNSLDIKSCALDLGRKVKGKTDPLIRKDAAKDCFDWNCY